MKKEIKDNLRDGARFRNVGGGICTLAYTPAVKGWALYDDIKSTYTRELSDTPEGAFNDDFEDFTPYNPEKEWQDNLKEGQKFIHSSPGKNDNNPYTLCRILPSNQWILIGDLGEIWHSVTNSAKNAFGGCIDRFQPA